MSWQATTWAANQITGDPLRKVLLLAIANYADDVGICWPRQGTLARDTEMSDRSIRRKLTELEEGGFLTQEQRFDVNGRQAANQLRLKMPTRTDCPPSGGEVDSGGHPGRTLESTLNELPIKHPKDSPASRAKKGKVVIYPEQFERDVWESYPRKQGTSKINALRKFEALSEVDRALAIKTIPIYVQLKKGKDPEHIHHLEFFISKRIFETLSISAAATANPDWLATATRVQWAKILKIWRGDQNWRLSWGPAPGKPGCHVPADMLFPGES